SMRSSVTSNRLPCSVITRTWRKSFLPFGLLTTASMEASVVSEGPFQSHTATPPISFTGFGKFEGAAFSRASTSSKLDLPEPLGPMRTFSPRISRSMPSGPKDRRPATFKRLMNMTDHLWAEKPIAPSSHVDLKYDGGLGRQIPQ